MMLAALSFVATSIIVVFLWQKAPEDGLVTYTKGYELTEAQIESNIAFYGFADLSLAFAPFLSVFYVSFLVLIEPLIGKLLSPLNSFGRMAFTNYIAQSVILVILLMFIPMDRVVSYTIATIICALIEIAQIIASSLWLKFFKYGPLEWIWRCGTYGKWLPIRKRQMLWKILNIYNLYPLILEKIVQSSWSVCWTINAIKMLEKR